MADVRKLKIVHSEMGRQEVVARQEEYLYSSAVNYAGGKGLLERKTKYSSKLTPRKSPSPPSERCAMPPIRWR